MALFLADLVLIVHALFIVFVIFGGFVILKWHGMIWAHIPCVIWGALIEFFAWICPLTYLENYLRNYGGINYYEGSFIQHYILPVVYPSGLTTDIQMLLGFLVIVINLAVYGFVWRNWK